MKLKRTEVNGGVYPFSVTQDVKVNDGPTGKMRTIMVTNLK